jgi:membrane-associated protein
LNLQEISGEIISFAGTFNLWLVISIFLLLTVNEFGFSIPYLMETVWILAGFHVRAGTLPIYQLATLMAVAMAGRILGSLFLYKIISLGSTWLLRFYRRIFKDALATDNSQPKSLAARMMKKISLLSPFTVAGGRLLWLKVPLTITMGIRRDLKVLEWAVILSSLIWDSTYVAVGVILGNIKTEPPFLVLYSLSVLTAIYGSTYIVRRFLNRRAYKTD